MARGGWAITGMVLDGHGLYPVDTTSVEMKFGNCFSFRRQVVGGGDGSSGKCSSIPATIAGGTPRERATSGPRSRRDEAVTAQAVSHQAFASWLSGPASTDAWYVPEVCSVSGCTCEPPLDMVKKTSTSPSIPVRTNSSRLPRRDLGARRRRIIDRDNLMLAAHPRSRWHRLCSRPSTTPLARSDRAVQKNLDLPPVGRSRARAIASGGLCERMPGAVGFSGFDLRNVISRIRPRFAFCGLKRHLSCSHRRRCKRFAERKRRQRDECIRIAG